MNIDGRKKDEKIWKNLHWLSRVSNGIKQRKRKKTRDFSIITLSCLTVLPKGKGFREGFEAEQWDIFTDILQEIWPSKPQGSLSGKLTGGAGVYSIWQMEVGIKSFDSEGRHCSYWWNKEYNWGLQSQKYMRDTWNIPKLWSGDVAFSPASWMNIRGPKGAEKNILYSLSEKKNGRRKRQTF